MDDPLIEDERLELIFTCCHPALAAEAQVALTLRAWAAFQRTRSRARSSCPRRR
jgi:predicted RNA polymerase sigma factor